MVTLHLSQPLLPLAWFDRIDLATANELLIRWQHVIGPINRPMNGTPITGGGDFAHALVVEGNPVALTVTSSLISENVAGHPELTRDNTIELSRLCSARPGLCRVALRMWREIVFAAMPSPHAISYQDADIHTGNTYRFDGWRRIAYSRSGTDRRSGKTGRKKWIWFWSKLPKSEWPQQACTPIDIRRHAERGGLCGPVAKVEWEAK